MLIKNNEIHIWSLDDQNSSVDMDRLSRSLTSDEWERHDRFVFEKDRRQFLVTRAMIREVLSRYRPEITPISWRFTVNAFGKPSIDDTQCDGRLHFNIAHTSRAITIALQAQPDIGIDIECLDRRVRDLSLFKSVLTSREMEQIHALPMSQRERQFYTFWTLKEAYIKAIGKGLSIPLEGFGFELSDHDHPSIHLYTHEDFDLLNWQFRSWVVAPNHVMALAFKKSQNTSENSVVKIYEFL